MEFGRIVSAETGDDVDFLFETKGFEFLLGAFLCELEE